MHDATCSISFLLTWAKISSRNCKICISHPNQLSPFNRKGKHVKRVMRKLECFGGWRRFYAFWNYAWDNPAPANQQLSSSVVSAHPLTSFSLVSTISKYNSPRSLMRVWLAWLPLCLHVTAGRRAAAVIRHGEVTDAGVYGHPNILHITTIQPWEVEACCCLYFIEKRKLEKSTEYKGQNERLLKPFEWCCQMCECVHNFTHTVIVFKCWTKFSWSASLWLFKQHFFLVECDIISTKLL